MRVKSVKSVVILLCLGAALLAGIAFGDCESYPNSRIRSYGGGGICASTGSGCTTCWNTEGGGSCSTDGSSCVPRPVIKH